jgi:aryl carrier-like protein
MVADLSERLASVLPSHMVPSAYIPLEHMPMMATGKTDRRRLRHIAEAFYLEQAICNFEQNRIAPSGSTEEKLLSIWAEVLNLDKKSLSTNTPFTQLGGDSITAMQVVSRCRARNISVTVRDILHGQTIQKVAASCNDIVNFDNPFKSAEGTLWTLSPIQ